MLYVYMKRSDFEIMAPVGSRESLSAAINAGADAVYFGVEGLNMRSKNGAVFQTKYGVVATSPSTTFATLRPPAPATE